VGRTRRGVDVHGVLDHLSGAVQRTLRSGAGSWALLAISCWTKAGSEAARLGQELSSRPARRANRVTLALGVRTPRRSRAGYPGRSKSWNHPVSDPVLPAGGTTSPYTSRRNASGIWMSTPAPSPNRRPSGRTPVLEILQDGERVEDRRVGWRGTQVRDHPHTAGVVLERGS